MSTSNNQPLIQQLTSLIVIGNAHITFDEAVENLSVKSIGVKPVNLPYSIWMLVEHIRIAQADILDFSSNPDYKAMNWPNDYWPNQDAPKSESAWQQSLLQIKEDRESFIKLLNIPGVDLFAQFPYGDGQNLLREALLIADHTSYHTGQIVLIRRWLNDWKND